MKQIRGILASLFLLPCLLTGCQIHVTNNETQTTEEQQEIIKKAQEIQIVNPATDTISMTYTDSQEIETIVKELDIENWMPSVSISEKDYSHPTMKIVFRQQKTKQLLQKEADSTMYTNCILTAYEDCPYLFFQFAGITIPMQISEQAQSYLETLSADMQA